MDHNSADYALNLAKAIMNARRRRGEVLDAHIFHDPAWDIVLYLSIIHGADADLETLAEAAGTSPDTAQRWLQVLKKEQLVLEHAGVDRPTYCLHSSAYELMKRWLSSFAADIGLS